MCDGGVETRAVGCVVEVTSAGRAGWWGGWQPVISSHSVAEEPLHACITSCVIPACQPPDRSASLFTSFLLYLHFSISMHQIGNYDKVPSRQALEPFVFCSSRTYTRLLATPYNAIPMLRVSQLGVQISPP
jgi:hypothetical protein